MTLAMPANKEGEMEIGGGGGGAGEHIMVKSPGSHS